jgi:succinoglycan biosynthesis transport protein ExoP
MPAGQNRPTPHRAADSEERALIPQLNVTDVVGLFFRRKLVFVLSALAVLVGGGIYLIWVTPQYRSAAAVVVRFDDKSIPESNLARDSSAVVTAQNERHETVLAHSDILTSPDLARAVIEKVGLENAYADVVSDPPSWGTPMDEALRLFAKKLDVDPEQQGNVIHITFDHPDPEMARTILQDLISGYMHREADIFSHPDIDFQKVQVAEADSRLQKAQAELRDYKAENGITSFDEQLTALITQRTDTNEALQSANVTLIQSTQRRDELQRLIAKVPASLLNTAGGEKYRSLDDAQAALAGLQVKEQQMLATWRADSPVMDQLRASIESATANLRARRGEIARRDASAPNLVFQNIQTDLLRATAEALAGAHSVETLKGQVEFLDRRQDQLEHLRTSLLERNRAVEIADSAFRATSLHFEDARVADSRLNDRISRGAIISQPSLPYKPSKPRYILMSVAFAVASIMVAIGMVLLTELLDDRFTDPAQITRMMGIPVLATFDKPASQ